MRFKQFFTEAPMPPPPAGGMGGGMPPIPGGLGGAPLSPGGGMPPPMMGGGGMPPPMMGGMGGAGGAQPGQQPPVEVQTKDVWSLLEKLLSGKPMNDNKDKPDDKASPNLNKGLQN